jgi:hypothetical protein
MPTATLAQEILLGERDFELDVLANAIVRRRKQIAEARAASMAIGDRVRLQGLGMGSKYLNGATGTIIGFLTKNIKVQIDPEFDTRRFGHTLKVPPNLLRALMPEEDLRHRAWLEHDPEDDEDAEEG